MSEIKNGRYETNGKISYYKNDLFHREDGPAFEKSNGDKFWYKNDLLHRDDGPACEYADGDKFWYQNDLLHREDGPAFEGSSGRKKWFINDIELSEEDFNHWLNKKKLNEKLKFSLLSSRPMKRGKI